MGELDKASGTRTNTEALEGNKALEKSNAEIWTSVMNNMKTDAEKIGYPYFINVPGESGRSKPLEGALILLAPAREFAKRSIFLPQNLMIVITRDGPRIITSGGDDRALEEINKIIEKRFTGDLENKPFMGADEKVEMLEFSRVRVGNIVYNSIPAEITFDEIRDVIQRSKDLAKTLCENSKPFQQRKQLAESIALGQKVGDFLGKEQVQAQITSPPTAQAPGAPQT